MLIFMKGLEWFILPPELAWVIFYPICLGFLSSSDVSIKMYATIGVQSNIPLFI